jgi:hypothetical protein
MRIKRIPNKFRIEGDLCFIDVETKIGKNTAIIDAIDYDRVKGIHWSQSKPGGANGVYLKAHMGIYENGKINSRTISLHRLITSFEWDIVDHIDGDTLNNTRANLRSTTIAENARNSRLAKNSTTGAKGVSATHNGKFRATIFANCKNENLGSYKTIIEAANAYDLAAKKYYGEFARINGVA